MMDLYFLLHGLLLYSCYLLDCVGLAAAQPVQTRQRKGTSSQINCSEMGLKLHCKIKSVIGCYAIYMHLNEVICIPWSYFLYAKEDSLLRKKSKGVSPPHIFCLSVKTEGPSLGFAPRFQLPKSLLFFCFFWKLASFCVEQTLLFVLFFWGLFWGGGVKCERMDSFIRELEA